MRSWVLIAILWVAAMSTPGPGVANESPGVPDPVSAATRRAELLRAQAERAIGEVARLRDIRERLDRAMAAASRRLTDSLAESEQARLALDELERAAEQRRRSASTAMLERIRLARGEVGASGSSNRQILQLRFGLEWRGLEDRLVSARARLIAARRTGLLAAAELAIDAAALVDAEAAASAAESTLREVGVGLREAELRRIALAARVTAASVASLAEDNSRADLVEITTAVRSGGLHESPSGWSGALRMPVEGTIVQRFGDRRGHQRARGIALTAPRSQPVLAPGAGTVLFAGPFRGLGSVLIIEHGEDYHSLVIGASKLVVERGEMVASGQPVGWWAGAGEGAADIYLELRKAGEPIDPLPMFTGREGEVRG